MAKKKHPKKFEDMSELEQEKATVTARGPGAPTARERARAKARAEAVEVDNTDLQPQMPGVDAMLVREDPNENPRLGNSDLAKQSRRAHEIWTKRAERGEACRRQIYDKQGKPIPGATTSSV